MKYLLEFHRHAEESLPQYVCQAVYRYNMEHGHMLSAEYAMFFEKYLPKGKIKLYRGMGFPVVDGPRILNKLKVKNLGDTGIYKSGKMQSWTTDKKIAEQFAGTFNIAGRNKGSLGIVISITAEPEDIVFPLGNLPEDIKKKCLRYDQQEYIIKPGKYDIKVEEMLGDWPKENTNIKKEYIRIGSNLAKKHDAKLIKNWNKSPGFGLDFNYPQYSDGKKLWFPSLQVFFEDDLSISFEIFGLSNKNPRKEKRFKNFEQLGEYITTTLQDDLENFIQQMKPQMKKDWMSSRHRADKVNMSDV